MLFGIIWIKDQAAMGSMLRSQTEFVIALKKHGCHATTCSSASTAGTEALPSFIRAPAKGSDANKMLGSHPTPKPIPMLIPMLIDAA